MSPGLTWNRSLTDIFERLRELRPVELARDNTLLIGSLAFLIGSILIGGILELIGFPVMAALTVAFGVTMTVILILFVAVPVYALSFLD